MKKRTLLAVFMALTMSASAFALASCGGNTGDTSTQTNTSETQTVISYQFGGNYDELLSWGIVFDFNVDLTSDGVATIRIHDTKEVTESVGTWKEGKEDDEKILIVKDDKGNKFNVYFNNDGSCTMKGFAFTFNGSYSRTIDLKGSSKATYANVDAWKASVANRRKGMDIPQLGGDSTSASGDNK